MQYTSTEIKETLARTHNQYSRQLLEHTYTNMQQKHTYNHTYTAPRLDQVILNSDETTCTLFTRNPAEYNTRNNLQINNIILGTHIHKKILGIALNLKVTTNTLTT